MSPSTNRGPRLIRLGEQEARPVAVATGEARPAPTHVVRTGPSGLLLGQGAAGPVSIRLFRPRPTRILVSAQPYVAWLVAFRSISLGAHLSVVTADAARWEGLVQAVRSCGGTIDVVGPGTPMPSQGRPYRPSLVIDDEASFDGTAATLGPWQAILVAGDASAAGTVHDLRASDMAIVGAAHERAGENLRRAYALNTAQARLTQGLQPNEVVLAMPRRVVRVAVPPTQTEYRLLFG